MNHRSIGALLGLAVPILILLPSLGAAQGCNQEMDEFSTYSLDSGANASVYVLAQSFSPSSTYTLCAVSVILQSAGGSQTATLYVQDDPTASPTTIYGQASLSVPSGASAWYKFDIPDFTVTAGQTYYIRVVGQVLFRDSASAGGNYPGGDAYQNGTPITTYDHFFKAWTTGPDLPSSVPTLSQWGAILLAALLMVRVGVALRRRARGELS